MRHRGPLLQSKKHFLEQENSKYWEKSFQEFFADPFNLPKMQCSNVFKTAEVKKDFELLPLLKEWENTLKVNLKQNNG